MHTLTAPTIVGDVIAVFVDTITALLSSITSMVLDVFGDLVFDSVTGLTPVATWGLVFGGVALVLGFVNRFIKA